MYVISQCIKALTYIIILLQEIGFEASDPGLISGFTNFFSNQTANGATVKKSKRTSTDSDVPVCILVELSKKGSKLSRLQHKARLKHNSMPEDILTKLHAYPYSN